MANCSTPWNLRYFLKNAFSPEVFFSILANFTAICKWDLFLTFGLFSTLDLILFFADLLLWPKLILHGKVFSNLQKWHLFAISFYRVEKKLQASVVAANFLCLMETCYILPAIEMSTYIYSLKNKEGWFPLRIINGRAVAKQVNTWM